MCAETDSYGELTIQLSDIGTPKNQVEFLVYKIADMNSSGSEWIVDKRLELVYSDIDLNQEKTASQWEKEAEILTSAIKSTEIPSMIGITDENGRLVLQKLEHGMYLIVQNYRAEYGTVAPFLAAFPEQIDGEWVNEMTIHPKGEMIKEEENPDEPVETGDGTRILPYAVAVLLSFVCIVKVIRRYFARKSGRKIISIGVILVVAGTFALPVNSLSRSVKAANETVIPEWATNVVIETPPDEQYVYQFSDSCPLYQRGQYRFGCGYYNCAPSPVILLVDGSKYNESIGTTWTANGLDYVPGVSNYELVYCADFDTDTVADQFYKKVNVEDSTYFESAEDAYKLRAIVGNTYPFVPAAQMVKDLYEKGVIADHSILLHGKTFADDYTDSDIDVGQLIAASQMAVWVVCNDTMNYAYVNSGVHTYYTLHPDNTSMQPKGKLNQVKDYPNADSETETEFDMTEGQAANINAIYQYLMNLKPVTEEEADKLQQLVITDVGYGATKAGSGNYDVTVTVFLNTAIKKNDNLTLKVSAGQPDSSGNTVEDVKVFQSQGTGEVIGKEFSFSLKDLPAGTEIRIELEGEQYLNQGVYFYEPFLREGETERTSSQNMVGASVGYTPVKASASFNIDDEEIAWEAKMPSTGGSGTIWFYSAGMTALSYCFCLYKYKNTKAKNKREFEK